MTTLENIRFGIMRDTSIDRVCDGLDRLAKAIIIIGMMVGIWINV